jgi:hypothetical protein
MINETERGIPNRKRGVGKTNLALRSVVVAALLVFICFGMSGCPDPGKSAAAALDKFSLALGDVQQGFVQAHQDGLIADADNKQIESVIDQAQATGEASVAALRAGDKATALVKINAVLVLIDDLNANGTLHIKNTDRQLAVKALIASLRAGVVIAQSFLQ